MWKLSSIAEAFQAAEGFDELPTDKSYLAGDKNLMTIVAFYHDAYERTWGKDHRRFIVNMTTETNQRLCVLSSLDSRWMLLAIQAIKPGLKRSSSGDGMY
jgi:hypothetical protein